jgi:cell division protein FtsN
LPPASTALPVVAPVYRLYSIEAGATDDQALAEQLQAAYSKQGLQVAVENRWDEKFGRKRYRVLIGMFKTKEAAENKAAQLGDKLVPSARVVGIE